VTPERVREQHAQWVDALLHRGEAQGVAERGGQSFRATFTRVLPMEFVK